MPTKEKDTEPKDHLAELFGQLRRYHPIGIWCERCGSEIWIADHTFHKDLVSVRCRCRLQFILQTELPKSYQGWTEFWVPRFGK
jgi:hypothetical protein